MFAWEQGRVTPFFGKWIGAERIVRTFLGVGGGILWRAGCVSVSE